MYIPSLASHWVAASVLLAAACTSLAATNLASPDDPTVEDVTIGAENVTIGAAVSTTSFDCPDTGVEEIKPQIRFGPMQKCGAGLKVSTGPVTINTPSNECPIFVVYEPARHVPTQRRGYYTKLSGTIAPVMVSFRCRSIRLFWLFPISSSCEQSGQVNLKGVGTYTQHVCAAAAIPAQPTGDK